jgi:hypothetical protein
LAAQTMVLRCGIFDRRPCFCHSSYCGHFLKLALFEGPGSRQLKGEQLQ